MDPRESLPARGARPETDHQGTGPQRRSNPLGTTRKPRFSGAAPGTGGEGAPIHAGPKPTPGRGSRCCWLVPPPPPRVWLIGDLACAFLIKRQQLCAAPSHTAGSLVGSGEAGVLSPRRVHGQGCPSPRAPARVRRAGRGRGAEAPGGTRPSPARPPPRVYKSLHAGSASSSVPARWSAPRTRPAVREFAGPSASVGWVGGFRREQRTWGDRCAARCQTQAGDRSRRWAVAVPLVSLGSRSGFLSPFLSLFSFVSKRFPPASLHFWVKNLTEDVWLYGGVFVGACACTRTQCQL